MALVRLPTPQLISTIPAQPLAGQMNALNESVAGIGHLHLEGGPGTKTLSAAGGGAIVWANSGTPVFANAGTTLRLGLQDASLVNFMESGTFDVYADLVGGSATIPTNGWLTTVMTSGSKTLSHGDVFATAWKMLSRAGTDTVSAQRTYAFPWSSGLGYNFSVAVWPHGAHNTGTGNSRQEEIPVAFIRFDDGTYGWISGTAPCMQPSGSNSAFSGISTATTPDEYAAVVALSFRATISHFAFLPNNLSGTTNFSVSILSDPWGTPTDIPGMPVAWSAQKLYQVQNAAVLISHLPTPLTVEAGVPVAVSWWPTASSSNFSYFAVTSGYGAILKKALPFSVAKVAARTDHTGPFVETSVDHFPLLGLYLSHLEAGGSIQPKLHEYRRRRVS